jgi:hypothetical protein
MSIAIRELPEARLDELLSDRELSAPITACWEAKARERRPADDRDGGVCAVNPDQAADRPGV